MAICNVSFTRVSNFNGTAIIRPEAVQSQAITTSSSSQQSAAANSTQKVVRVTVAGGNVWVAIGVNPTAVAGTQFLMTDGSTEYFAVNDGDKVAVIDA